MSKKIISLVLFVAMLVAMIPGANALTGGIEVYIQDDGTNYWYAAENPQMISAATGKDTNGALLGAWAGYTGMTVKVEEKDATAGNNGKTIITLTGDITKLQPFYYTQYTTAGAWGKAVKIPFTTNAADTGDIRVNNNPNLSMLGDQYYIDVPLNAYGTYTYAINYAGTAADPITDGNYLPYIVEVVFKAATTAAQGVFNYPDLQVVALAGAHTENFRATYTNAADGKTTIQAGVLQFNIAAMTAADRLEIYNDTMTDSAAADPILWDSANLAANLASLEGKGYTIAFDATKGVWVVTLPGQANVVYSAENDVMTARLLATSYATGAKYPAGTIIELVAGAGEYANWANYLGKSSKYVNVNGTASYLIDQDGCFCFSYAGITEFAMEAAGSFNASADWNTGAITNGQTIYEDVNLGGNYVAMYTKRVNTATFQLRFSNGTLVENVYFNVWFQNTAKTKSGITVLANTMTVKVGAEEPIPFIVDDPYAMIQDTTAWTSVNAKIAALKATDNTVVVGKAVGTTYIFCTDAKGDIELVIVNVVNDAVVAPEVVAPVESEYDNYVVTASKLNIRTGAGTSYDRLTKNGNAVQFARNDVVAAKACATEGWLEVVVEGYEGSYYCSATYLAKIVD